MTGTDENSVHGVSAKSGIIVPVSKTQWERPEQGIISVHLWQCLPVM